MSRMNSVTPTGADFDVRWVELGGQGRPIVYLHGWGCSSSASFADAARRSGRPAALVDLVGHGLSDRPQHFGYGLHEHVDALADAVRAYADAPVDLVGHSLGGTLALLLAQRHPQLIRRALLVEPAIDAFPVEPQHYAARDEDELRADGGRDALQSETPERRAEMRLADPIALRRIALTLHDALDDTLHASLATPVVPTLLLLGGQRTYRDDDDFRAGGIDIRRLPQAGHFVMNDAPAEYDAIVREFFAEAS